MATCTCKPWFLVLECPKCMSLGVSLVWVREGRGLEGSGFCVGFSAGCFGWFSGIFFERTLMLFEALFF